MKHEPPDQKLEDAAKPLLWMGAVLAIVGVIGLVWSMV